MRLFIGLRAPNTLASITLTLLLSTALTAEPVQVADRQAHQQTVTFVRSSVDARGVPQTFTHQYVELADGLNRLDASGQWAPADPSFRLARGWALADGCQHQVAIALDPQRPGGVQLTPPDGRTLRSHVVGLSYFDTATGRSVLLAELRETRGQLEGPTQLLFPNAFDDLRADLRYTMSLRGLEQDVILREAPPAPEEFGFDSATTQLEVLTEFLQPPAPKISRRSLAEPNPDLAQPASETATSLADETLDFGAMSVGAGRAFDLQSEANTVAPVGKRWTRLGQRDFLIEAVGYSALRESLLRLRPGAKSVEVDRSNPLARRPRQIATTPDQRPIGPPRSDAQVAVAPQAAPPAGSLATHTPGLISTPALAPEPGLVIDYIFTLTPSQLPARFRADTTYYVSGPASFMGITFEGGTVIKYAPGATLSAELSVVAENSDSRPVLFTAATDDSVGEPVALGTASYPRPPPTTYFGSPCLRIRGSGTSYPCTLSAAHFRFAHAVTGLLLEGGTGHSLRHSQFRDCQTALELQSTAGGSLYLRLQNALIARCGTAFNSYGSGISLWGHHLTLADLGSLGSGMSTPTVSFRNCLLAGVANLSGITVDPNAGNAVTPATLGTFERAGAGWYYLPAGSPHRGVCNANQLDPVLVTELARRTSDAPLLASGTLARESLLGPRVRLETDPTRLNRGYHYPALDYLVSGWRLAGGTLRLAAGASLGVYGPAGLVLGPGGSLKAEGQPPVRILRFQAIQEQPTGGSGPDWVRTGSETLIDVEPAGATGSQFTGRFLELSVPAGTGALVNGRGQLGLVGLTDAQLFGGAVTLDATGDTGRSANFQNCLFQGANLALRSAAGSLFARLRHNTLREGRIELQPEPEAAWELYDNLFAEVDFVRAATGLKHDFNAYYRATNVTSAGARSLISATGLPTNSIVLSSMSFVSGPFGSSYHGTSLLKDRGSKNASQAGLYHHTTSPTQAKELNTRVDIGFHYLATSNGLATDTDGDGLADLDEDLDGDGLTAPPAAFGLRQESAFDLADTDGDGFNDGEELQRGSNPRDADLFPGGLLARWRFDDATFASEQGDVPTLSFQAQSDPLTWDGAAASLNIVPGSNLYRWLGYPWRRVRGRPLLNPTRGAVQFWFKPNWSSRATGTPEDGFNATRKLVTVQGAGDEGEYWAFELNPGGTLATLSVLRRGASLPRSTSWPVAFTRGQWHLLTLNYGPDGLELWLNDHPLVPSGPLFVPEPWPADISSPKTLWIGGWNFAALPRTANGSFENLCTFDSRLQPGTIEQEYTRVASLDSDGDGLPDLLELRLPGFFAGNRDSDGDGLPDKWEYDNFGGNSATPGADPDQDLASNLEEYIQNRSPRLFDSRWPELRVVQLVRDAADLVNIDFAPATRTVPEGGALVRFSGTSVLPVASSLDPAGDNSAPSADLWNVVTPESLGPAGIPTQPIRTVAGGLTQLALFAEFGPLWHRVQGACPPGVPSPTSTAIPTLHVDYPDLGLVTGNLVLPPTAPPWPDCPHPWGSPLLGGIPLPLPPNAPGPRLPFGWWWGSSWHDFRPVCVGDRGLLPPVIGLPSPTPDPASASPISGQLPGFPGSNFGPPTYGVTPDCPGGFEAVYQPAFQAAARFNTAAGDAGRVTTHPMFADYLFTPQELQVWRQDLEARGYNLASARSTLYVAGLSQGPWRLILYSATQNDERSCQIAVSTGPLTSPPSGSYGSHGSNPSRSEPKLDFVEDRYDTVIRPGKRSTLEFIEGRHYVQTALDVGADGALAIQFQDHSALNGLQLVRLRPLEPVEWAQPIEANPALGLILRWRPVPSALNYSVSRANTATGPWTPLVQELRQTSFRDTTAVPQGAGGTYWYKIEAHNERFTSASEPAAGNLPNLAPGNRPPSLSYILPLGPAFDRDLFALSLTELRAKAVASDFEGNSLEFRIERVLTGRLLVDGLEVSDEVLAVASTANPGRYLIRLGTRVEWQSLDGVPGRTPAFEVRAFDGARFSDQTAVVPIEVRPPTMVVWWGSSYHNAAGTGHLTDPTLERAKHPNARWELRYDPDYWSELPTPIPGPLRNVVQLVARSGITLALQGDRTLWSWGTGGVLAGRGGPFCPASAPLCSLPWFDTQPIATPQPVPFPTPAPRLRQIAIGSAHAIAVTTDGTLYLWGANTLLSEGLIDRPTHALDILPSAVLDTATLTGPYDPSNPLDSAAAAQFAITGASTPTLVPGLHDLVKAACSDYAVAVLDAAGSVQDWGTLTYFDGREFRTGPGGSISVSGANRRLLDQATPSARPLPAPAVDLAAGAQFFLALTDSGDVYAWGANDSGAFADRTWIFDPTDPAAVGTLTPRKVPGLAQVTQIAASGNYAMALSAQGVVFEWGRSPAGTGWIQSPRPVAGLPQIARITATADQAFAIDTQGRVWGWGQNGHFNDSADFSTPSGLLQPASRLDTIETPTLLPDLEQVVDLSAATPEVLHAITALRPNAPRGLIASPGNARVHLSWRAVAGATEYRLYRSSSPEAGYLQIGTKPSRAGWPLEWDDTTLRNGQSAFYRVSGVVGGRETDLSPYAWAQALLPPTRVATFEVRPQARALLLEWCPATNALEYQILRAGPYATPPASLPSADFRPVYRPTLSQLTENLTGPPDCAQNRFRFLDAELEPGRWYAYRLLGSNASGDASPAEAFQQAGAASTGPGSPTLGSVTQRDTVAVASFQKNHTSTRTAWLVKLFHHNRLDASDPCAPGFTPTMPPANDNGWSLDRTLVLPDLQGASAAQMALAVPGGSAGRQLLLDGLPTGVWHKLAVVAVTEKGLSSEGSESIKVFRTTLAATTTPEILVAASGPGYIYVRYRHDAGFFPTSLWPKPMPCATGTLPRFDPTQCLQFTEWPWNAATGETETWLLQLPALPNSQPYRLRIEPGASAGPDLAFEQEFTVTEREPTPPFEIQTTLGDGRIRLDWYSDAVRDAYAGWKFVVERVAAIDHGGVLPASCALDTAWSFRYEGPDYRFEDRGLANGADYQYRVLALNPDTGQLVWALTPVLRPDPALSAATANALAAGFNAEPRNGAVRLTWPAVTSRSSSQTLRYSLYHSLSPTDPGAVLNEIEITQYNAQTTPFTYLHQPLENGVTHYYRLVLTVDDLDQFIQIGQATPAADRPPLSPTGLSIRKISVGGSYRFLLDWEPVPEARAYQIYMRRGGPSGTLTKTLVGATHYAVLFTPSPSNEPDPQFCVTALGTGGRESDSITNTSPLFRPAHVFSSVADNTAPIAADGAEYVALLLARTPGQPITRIVTPTNLVLRASVAFSAQRIHRVEYYSNDEKIGEAKVAPYAFEWVNPPASPPEGHALVALAVTDHGAVRASPVERLLVSRRPPLSEFTLQQGELELRTASPPFTLTREYHSQDDSVGLLGRGWTFNFERARLLRPDLANGWNVIGTGLGHAFAAVQDAPGARHELQVTLPGGQTLRFAPVPAFLGSPTVRDLEWLPLLDDFGSLTEANLGALKLSFIATDGSGATLATSDEDELVGFTLGPANNTPGAQLLSLQLVGSTGQPYAPTHFILTLSDRTQLEFRSSGASTQPEQSLRLERILDRRGSYLKFVAQRSDRSELVGADFAEASVRRIAIQAYTPADVLIRECWLDRIPGSPTRWLLFDPVGVEAALAAATINPAAAWPGNLTTPPVRCYNQSASRLDSVDELATRSPASWSTERFTYLSFPADPVSLAPARELLETLINPDGVRVLKNTYVLQDGLIVLTRQEDARGVVRTLGYDAPQAVSSTVTTASSGGAVVQESLSYDAGGAVTGAVDPTGVRHAQILDERGRVSFIGATSADAGAPWVNTTAYTYDSKDRIIATTDPSGQVTTSEFTEDSQPSQITDPNHHTTTYLYFEESAPDGSNPAGLLRTEIDAVGQPVEYTYNPRGQITSETRSSSGSTVVTRYEYYETRSSVGRPGDLRRTYHPLAEVCLDPTKPLPGPLPTFATEYTYDDNGNTRSETTLRTVRVVETPTGGGAPTELTRSERCVTEYTRDPDNRVIATLRRRVLLDTAGNPIAGSETVLEQTATTYNALGYSTGATDSFGRRTTESYDALGRLLQTSFPDGTVTRTVYDDFGRPRFAQERGRPSIAPTATDPALGVTVAPATETLYDAAGRTLWTSRRSNVSITLEADTAYAGYSSVNRRQYRTRLSLPESTALGTPLATNRFVYDAFGRLQYQVSPRGALTETVYDAASRRAATLVYDLDSFPTGSEPIVITQQHALKTTYGYDAAGQDLWIREPDSQPPAGQPEDPARRTEFEYDALGRRVTVRYPSIAGVRHETHTTYDALGRALTETAEDGVITAFRYDPLGRLVAVIQDFNPALTDTQQSLVTRYEYDEAGHPIAQIDALGRRTRFESDALGRRTARILPGGSLLSPAGSGFRELTEYHAVQDSPATPAIKVLVKKVTDFSGRLTEYHHDTLDRLKKVLLPANAPSLGPTLVTREYTDWGAPAKVMEYFGSPPATTPARTTEYTYKSDTRQLDFRSSPEGTLRYTFDSEHRVKRTVATYLALFLVATGYDYDRLGRLDTVREFASAADSVGAVIARYTYGSDGNLGRLTLGNGVQSSYTYDARHRLTRLAAVRGSAATAPEIAAFDYNPASRPFSPTGQRQAVIESFTGLNAAGLPVSGSSRSRRVDYTYDTLGRLTREEVQPASIAGSAMLGTAGNVAYQFDRVGNRRQRTPSSSLATLVPPQNSLNYDAQDLTDNDANPATRSAWFDLNGNAIARPTSAATAVATGDQYDAQDRLIRRAASQSAPAIMVTYDAENRRVRKSVGDRLTYHLVDDLNPSGYTQVLAEYTLQGATPVFGRSYHYGLDLLCQQDSVAGANRRYFGKDGLESTRFLTDAGGLPTHLFQYDAYGALLSRLDWVASSSTVGAWSSAANPESSLPTQYLYAGEAWDPDLRLSYNRARYYDPTQGRFWTRDTYEGTSRAPGSLHKYLYCNASPVNLIDPTGYLASSVEVSAATATGTTLQATRLSVGANAILANTLLSGARGIQNDQEIRRVARDLGVEVEPALYLSDLQRGVDRMAPKRKRPQAWEYFAHGTSTGAWRNSTSIRANGGGDFGTGFYTFRANLSGLLATAGRAARTARSPLAGGLPFILVTKIRQDHLDGMMPSAQDFRNDSARWTTAVKGYLNNGGKGLSGHPIVIGPVSAQGRALRPSSIPTQRADLPDQWKWEDVTKLRPAAVIPVFGDFSQAQTW